MIRNELTESMRRKTWTSILLICLVALLTVESMDTRRRFLPFILKDGPTNVTVNMNQDVRLPCRIQYLGPKKVAWVKLINGYSSVVTVGTEVYDTSYAGFVSVDNFMNGTLSGWDLIIQNVQPQHSGTYECQVSATSAPKRQVYLRVIDTPLVIDARIEIKGPQYVNLYEPIKLMCNATGSTKVPDEIDWFFQSDLIQTNDPQWQDRTIITRRVDVGTSKLSLLSELILDYSKQEDQGKYICRSINYKEDSKKFTGIEVNVLNTDKDVSKRGNEDDEEHRVLSEDQSEQSGLMSRSGTSGSHEINTLFSGVLLVVPLVTYMYQIYV